MEPWGFTVIITDNKVISRFKPVCLLYAEPFKSESLNKVKEFQERLI